MAPEVAISIPHIDGRGTNDGYETIYNGEASLVEVAIGDYSVQFEIDSYGTLVIDVMNALKDRLPMVMEQHGRAGHDSVSLVLLVK